MQRVNVGNFRENSRGTVSVSSIGGNQGVVQTKYKYLFVKITLERFHKCFAQYKQKTSECPVRKKRFGTHSLILFPFYAAADSTL